MLKKKEALMSCKVDIVEETSVLKGPRRVWVLRTSKLLVCLGKVPMGRSF